MKLSQALKLKNLQAKKVSTLLQRAISNNSNNVNRSTAYNTKDVLVEYVQERDRLVDIKTKISQGSQPIQHFIYEMAELKIFITNLKQMDVTDGEEPPSYHSNIAIVKKAVIKEAERDEMVEVAEGQIQSLQAAIDAHNNQTEIDL